MRFWIWFALCLTLLAALWLIPNTNVLPRLTSYLIEPPLPSRPAHPPVPEIPIPTSGLPELRPTYESSVVLAALLSKDPCEENRAKAAEALVAGLTTTLKSEENKATEKQGLALLGALMTGQQTLDLRKQEAETREKRLRLYVQAGLTLLLAASCLYLLVHKKTTPTQRAAATGVLGIALGYWFK